MKNEKTDQRKVITIQRFDILRARLEFPSPIYLPVRKFVAVLRPQGIMNVKRPMFLKIVWPAVFVSFSIEASYVKTSNAHHPITLKRKEFQPSFIIGLKSFQDSSCIIGIKHF
jgi:hypothetical protein